MQPETQAKAGFLRRSKHSRPCEREMCGTKAADATGRQVSVIMAVRTMLPLGVEVLCPHAAYAQQ